MKMFKCFHCKKEDIQENLIKVNVDTPKKSMNRFFHNDCYKEYEIKREMKSQKQIEWEKWDSLYQYIKKEVFKYDENMKLSSHLVMRLQGFRSGKYLPSKNSKVFLSENGYPYEIILMTFKIKKVDIINAISDKSKFKNEKHKEDYVMVIIQNNINDVYLRLKEKKESDMRIENIEMTENKPAEFKNKSKINENKVASKLKHLF